jgi:hypothetical protein
MYIFHSCRVCLIIYKRYLHINADYSGRAVLGMNCLRSLEPCGFESHSRHGCLCAFILCLGSVHATGSFLIQGLLQTVYRI